MTMTLRQQMVFKFAQKKQLHGHGHHYYIKVATNFARLRQYDEVDIFAHIEWSKKA